MKVVLKLQSPNGDVEITIEAGKSVIVGRNNKSDCIIADGTLSGAHCKFTLIPPKLEIQDLGSKNGTFLNGLRIEQSEVYSGDEIKVGNSKITVLLDKMYLKSAQAIQFAGSSKDRVADGLKLDLDNSYHMSKLKKELANKKPSPMEKSLAAQNKPKEKDKSSKEEIKKLNKIKGTLSSTIDIIAFLVVLAIPLFFTNVLFFIDPQFLKNQLSFKLLFFEIAIITTFYFINYKVMKFTVGEKISGIEALYKDQD